MINQTLSNELQVPVLGIGTWKMAPEVTAESIKTAIQSGYRHIDTAAIYGNEKEVGEGIRLSGVPRHEIFLTTKLWNTEQTYDAALHAFDVSLKKLGTDYVDLYLIHWPKSTSPEAWRAMETIYKSGRAKAIGVSNFSIEYLNMIRDNCEIQPMVNQVERHPYYQQIELQEYCDLNNIALQAYTPLAQGKVFDEPILQSIAKKHGKSIAQVVLRWEIQTGFITFPKSQSATRLAENFDIFDFELDDHDLLSIRALNKDEKIGSKPEDTFVHNKF